MFEKILTRIVIFIFAWLILWGAFGTKAKATEIITSDVGSWGANYGFQTCYGYGGAKPCVSNGTYFSGDGIGTGDVVFAYSASYYIYNTFTMPAGFSGSTMYLSLDLMTGPRNSEQRNKYEYVVITVIQKDSSGNTLATNTINENINNTTMTTYDYTVAKNASTSSVYIQISGRDGGFWAGNYGAVIGAGTLSVNDGASAAPTYSSDPTAAQLQSRTDARNITTNGNAIYVTQSGDRADIDITQYDNDNLVAGTSSTANNITDATITGDDNSVSITQGNNAGSFSDDNVTLLDITGTNNSVTVRQGDNVDDVGGHRSTTNVVGNYNTLGILQENDGGVGSNGHYMEIDVAGNSNIMYMDQKDDGDKMLFLDVNGSSNDVDILQQGTGEHFLEVTAGSNQTIDINQDGSGSHAATIDMSGYSSTLDLDQTGSTDQTYSLTQICTNANGCGTTTINQN